MGGKQSKGESHHTEPGVFGIIVCDDAGIIGFANPLTEGILGFRPGELVGQSISVTLPEVIQKFHDKVLETYVHRNMGSWLGSKIMNRPRLLPMQHKDGRVIETVIMLVDTRKTGTFQTPAGRGARFLLAFKVASDHDRVALCPDEDQARRMPPGLAELVISPQVEAAKRRLAKLERAGDDSPVSSTFERMAVIAADETGKILFVNSWATELTYYSAKEMIGKDISMILPTDFRERHIQMVADYVERINHCVAAADGISEAFGGVVIRGESSGNVLSLATDSSHDSAATSPAPTPGPLSHPALELVGDADAAGDGSHASDLSLAPSDASSNSIILGQASARPPAAFEGGRAEVRGDGIHGSNSMQGIAGAVPSRVGDNRPPSNIIDRPRIGPIQSRSGKLKQMLVNLTDVGFGFELLHHGDDDSSISEGPVTSIAADSDASGATDGTQHPSTAHWRTTKTIRFVVAFKTPTDEEYEAMTGRRPMRKSGSAE